VRQVEKTKIVLDTRDVFFIVQGHRGIDSAAIEQTADVLATACLSLFGGTIEPMYP
jgi:DNA/RNA-binding domain of Phe-tRNA-synthetase-like protein